MYLHGSFLTQLGETITVYIVTDGSRAKQVEIGGEGSTVFFTDDPVEINSSVNDTFDHLLRNEATIRLLTRDFIPELFCASCMDAVVNIYMGDKCIFAGFIEPQAYEQSYNEVYDELELSCIDVLSALQYSKYKNVGGLGVLYEAVKSNAAQRTFLEILTETLAGATEAIDLNNAGGVQCYYDGSKSLTATSGRYDIFSQTAIFDLLFMGDEEDDVWQLNEVLEEMLKYLNLHIVQDGLQFYIFSWETVKSDGEIAWKDLIAGTAKTATRSTIEFGLDNVAAADTSISIGEVYNQIQLTCKIESIEDVIESPLDGDDLISPYSNKQKYLTELSADGEGSRAYDAFYKMCHDLPTDYVNGVITDWYIQVRNNPKWTFPEAATGANLIDKYCQGNINQQALPNKMSTMPAAAILSLGKVEYKTDQKDNSPVSKIDMTDYMVVSVNGNGKDDPATVYPTENSLRDSAPCAVYMGGISGGIYSPADDRTTNYIVLSGKIVLNPIMEFTRDYKTLHDADADTWEGPKYPGAIPFPTFWHDTVPSRNNGDGRYYTQKYYRAAMPSFEPVWDELITRGLVPYTGTGPQEYEFKYSAVGDGTDKISKVAVLACMLIIGDKCVVESGISGQISDFEWRTYKTREQCADDDEYYAQCFTIGFDPKIGDKLIGTEFDLQNNIDYTLGVDAEGIAIPIRKDTKLSGPVRFMILGPVNVMWDEITRRHRTWFRRTKWGVKTVPLMAHVSSIYIKSFEMKIYSDNGLINNVEDNDIVYMSDTHETFVNRKDDIEFKISSALTRAECQQLGVSDTINMSTILDLSTGYGLQSIYDQNQEQQAKAEQLYVDSYYTEYHKPRIQMVQKLDDCGGIVGLFNRYIHPAMPNKAFYVQGINRNLIEGYAELTIKEVWND